MHYTPKSLRKNQIFGVCFCVSTRVGSNTHMCYANTLEYIAKSTCSLLIPRFFTEPPRLRGFLPLMLHNRLF